MLKTEETQRPPTLHELRTMLDLSVTELAQFAGIHPRVAYWMEVGVSVSPEDAAKVLGVLSHMTGNRYTLANVRGLKLKSR